VAVLLGAAKQIKMTDVKEIVCARRVTNADHGSASCFHCGFQCGGRYRNDGGGTLRFLRCNQTSLTGMHVLATPNGGEAHTTCEPPSTTSKCIGGADAFRSGRRLEQPELGQRGNTIIKTDLLDDLAIDDFEHRSTGEVHLATRRRR